MKRPLLLCAGLALVGLLTCAAREGCRRQRAAARAAAREAAGVAGAARALRNRGLGVYLIPAAADGNPAAGVFLCREPRTRQQLAELIRGRPERWYGVLYVGRAPRGDTNLDASLVEWGPHAALAGPFLLFGDPDLVDQARRWLQDDRRQ